MSAKATKSKLAQLKDTILETAGANPLEDPTRTAQDMNKSKQALMESENQGSKLSMSGVGRGAGAGGPAGGQAKGGKPPIVLPVFAPYDSSRFGEQTQGDDGDATQKQGTGGQGGGDDFGSRINTEKTLREEELTNKDVRNARDLTLRQLLRIDNKASVDTMERYKTDGGDGGADY